MLIKILTTNSMTRVFITLNPYLLASFAICCISHDEPARCAGIITLGKVFLSFATSSFAFKALMLIKPVANSMSTKSTVASQKRAQLADATKVIERSNDIATGNAKEQTCNMKSTGSTIDCNTKLSTNSLGYVSQR